MQGLFIQWCEDKVAGGVLTAEGVAILQRTGVFIQCKDAARPDLIVIQVPARAAILDKGQPDLGTIGGVAAVLSQSSIKSIECVEYPELGMEAIWKITVEDFPAFILVDDKGNDFFKQLKPWPCKC